MNLLFETRMQGAERAAWWAALQAALPQHQWLDGASAEAADPARRAQVDAAVVANPAPGRLTGLPRLRLIQSLWAGVERLLADTSLPPEVPVARMVDPAMNAAMAQTACWAVLSLHRHFFTYAAQQLQAEWQPLPQRRADEVGVLVLGLGQMGGTAARALAGLGYPVQGWSATPREVPGVACHHGEPALAGLLGAADVVVNLLPLTAATQGLFDARRLAQMKPGAGLVNLARGGHVVEADLLAALAAGRPGHAVLDVFATEPLPAGHPFWAHPRVTVLPHAAAATDLRTAAAVVAANLQALADGRPLQHLARRDRGY